EDLVPVRGRRGVLELLVGHLQEPRRPAPNRRAHRRGRGCGAARLRALSGGGGRVLVGPTPMGYSIPLVHPALPPPFAPGGPPRGRARAAAGRDRASGRDL